MSEYKSNSPEKTMELGQKLASMLTGKEVIAYFGGLGMGKTTLTRGIVSGLGGEDVVSSPTFAIVNEYKAKYNVYHFDMYRISGWDDLYSTGFFDYLDNGIIIIEWSENIENALPEDIIKIEISKGNSDTERIFRIEGAEV